MLCSYKPHMKVTYGDRSRNLLLLATGVFSGNAQLYTGTICLSPKNVALHMCKQSPWLSIL